LLFDVLHPVGIGGFWALMLLYALSGKLFLSAAAARVVSATLNYILNRRFVFGLGYADRVSRSLPGTRRLPLVLAINYLMLRVLWALDAADRRQAAYRGGHLGFQLLDAAQICVWV
jgi:putative flippase GtrA